MGATGTGKACLACALGIAVSFSAILEKFIPSTYH